MSGSRWRSFAEFHCSKPVPPLPQVRLDGALSSLTLSCPVIQFHCTLLLPHRSRPGPCEIMGKGRRWLQHFLSLGYGDAHACSIVQQEARSSPAWLLSRLTCSCARSSFGIL